MCGGRGGGSNGPAHLSQLLWPRRMEHSNWTIHITCSHLFVKYLSVQPGPQSTCYREKEGFHNQKSGTNARWTEPRANHYTNSSLLSEWNLSNKWVTQTKFWVDYMPKKINTLTISLLEAIFMERVSRGDVALVEVMLRHNSECIEIEKSVIEEMGFFCYTWKRWDLEGWVL